MKWAIALTACLCLASSQEVKRPRITGVAHIGFMAQDINRSRAFYTGLLGWQEPYSLKNPDVTFFKINDRQYVELVSEDKPATDRLTHIALETDDAAGMLKNLASKGVKVPRRVTKDRIGNTSFTVTDPDKHIRGVRAGTSRMAGACARKASSWTTAAPARTCLTSASSSTRLNQR